ncbi:MAG: hypothetical protein C0606_09025 [Hyphomicrobiales bacterium]|nr:MAG: hypothetical protein C0606_09025 [Hyphomicrobiales bacterium]
MFDRLKSFFTELTQDRDADAAFAADDHRLAVAALLVHMIAVDGSVTGDEKDHLATILRARYGLSEAETKTLIEAARERDREAVDLYGFTSVLKRDLEEDDRRKVVEMMWDIAYADGQLHEFEDNTIWRVAELLGISSRDRIALRQKVEARSAAEKPDS